MRHSDPALTANIYTDAHLLPTFDAVAAMPWEGTVKAPPAPSGTQIDTQGLGPEGHLVAQTDTKNGEAKAQETTAIKGESHALASAVTESQMVGAVRFELTTSCTRNKRASQATLRPDLRAEEGAGTCDKLQCRNLKIVTFRFAPLLRNVSVRCAWNDSGNDLERRRHRARWAGRLDDPPAAFPRHAIVL